MESPNKGRWIVAATAIACLAAAALLSSEGCGTGDDEPPPEVPRVSAAAPDAAAVHPPRAEAPRVRPRAAKADGGVDDDPPADAGADAGVEGGVPVEIEVVDARTGRPVAGACAAFGRTFAARGEIDSGGRGTLVLPPGAGAVVTTTARGHFESADFVRAGEAGASPAVLRVALEPAGSVSGRVLDPDGRPVEGAGVEIRRTDADGSAPDAESGEDGSYCVDGLVLGARYAARANHIDFSTSAEAADLTPTEDRPDVVRDLRLRRPATLTLDVTDAEGEPIGLFHEEIVRSESSVWGRGDGRPEQVAPGHLTVRVWVSGGMGASTEVDLAEGEDRTVALRLERGGRISGVVVDGDGEPVEQVRVGVPTAAGDVRQDEPMAYTNGEGRFDVGPMPKGPHDVVFDAKFGRDEAFDSVVLRGVWVPSESLRVVLPQRGRLTMRVVPEDGPGSARGLLELAAPRGAATWRTSAALRPDGKVDVGLPGDVAGDVSIVLPGYEPARRRVVAAPGADVDLGEVRLRRGATLTAVLRCADGSAAARVRVLVGMGPSRRSVDTDAAGAFRVDGLASGPVRVECVGGPGTPPGVFHVVLPSPEVAALTLPSPGELTVVLLDRAGAPRPLREIVLRGADGEPVSAGGGGPSDERGRFETPLGPGVYAVEVAGFPPAKVEVRADDVTFLRLRER